MVLAPNKLANKTAVTAPKKRISRTKNPAETPPLDAKPASRQNGDKKDPVAATVYNKEKPTRRDFDATAGSPKIAVRKRGRPKKVEDLPETGAVLGKTSTGIKKKSKEHTDASKQIVTPLEDLTIAFLNEIAKGSIEFIKELKSKRARV